MDGVKTYHFPRWMGFSFINKPELPGVGVIHIVARIACAKRRQVTLAGGVWQVSSTTVRALAVLSGSFYRMRNML